ncbi:UvrD-helicase domain-containing protein [Aureibacter tunicatorum]|uniref:ATP-dependent exoDNAse (Exonuclease V) beta subunit n=1 Tax=Aureibacter tunicatorum TaxID=866807 RepID=A0AAE3XRY3_9BACT|nr:UvrD-helicase domain-containing protein [Aureibacter tunicatorum]MDR6240929.1 ATP-dependent exoDNAse (exonuclease V) beta subunit [Aureibacter tunicatorum]BDD03709.1 DNA helicase [Aureibacter tunicatorum]
MNKNFVIYRSSAGSGKTYTLAKEYLGQALRSEYHFKHILAVTFTNKATQEMKERIVSFLHEISIGDPSVGALTDDLAEMLQISSQEVVERSAKVLTRILHNYSHFSVLTIDSFFQQVIRSFAKELGLQGGIAIELDQDQVLNEVIDRVIEDVNDNPNLAKWLRLFAEKKVEEGKSWDIKDAVKSFSYELFSEKFKSLEEQVTEMNDTPDQVDEFLSTLQRTIREFEKKMSLFGTEAMDVLMDLGLTVDDFPYKKSSFANYFVKLKNGEEFTPGARALAALDDLNKWKTKSTPAGKASLIEDAFHQGANEALRKAVDYYNQQHKRYYSALEVLRYFYSFGILSDIINKLQEYRQEKDIMLISDASDFLKHIINENDSPFIYEKTGTKFFHFFIDEFQDTSRFQWDNFRPLVENSLAGEEYIGKDPLEGNKNLVLGDVKQSIYRWRGGDQTLLQFGIEKDIGNDYTKVEHLDTNWRSLKNVIEFNNSVFSVAPELLVSEIVSSAENLEEQEKEILEGKAYGIIQAYADVAQKVSPKHQKNEKKGFIRSEFVEAELDDDGNKIKPKEVILSRLPNHIEALQKQGIKARDIAFLVRNKQDGVLIADFFSRYKHANSHSLCNFDVVSSESLYVKNALVVRILVGAMKALLDLEDNLSWTALAHDFKVLNNEVKVSDNEIFEDRKKLKDALPTAFVSKVDYLYNFPIYELVEYLIPVFGLNEHTGERAYLQAFEDLVLEYLESNVGDVGSFVEWWDDKGVSKSIAMSDEMDAMRILTIHKSKGLQYKVVIIPFCDWSMDHNTTFDNILWTQSNYKPFEMLPTFPVKYQKGLKDTYFALEYYEEQIGAFLDNLNLMYVAFTRAEEYLFTFSEKPNLKKGVPIGNVGKLLYKSFEYATDEESMLKDGWKEESGVYEYGSIDKEKEISSKEDNSVKINQFISSDWRKRLSISRQDECIFNLDDTERVEKINYGILIHDILSKVLTPDQLESVLADYLEQGIINPEDKEVLRERIELLFANQQVRDWFITDWKVKTEVPILPKSGELSRLDRVLTKGNDAIIIDFKTGFQKKKDINQIIAYKALLKGMGFEKIQAFLLYLEDISIVEV